MKISKTQILRDKKAILAVLDRPKTFAQISLQAGEGLITAYRELLDEGKIIKQNREYLRAK